MNKIKKSQKQLISEAHSQWKNSAGSCFTKEAIGQNATIAKFIKHNSKHNANDGKQMNQT